MEDRAAQWRRRQADIVAQIVALEKHLLGDAWVAPDERSDGAGGTLKGAVG